VINGEKALETRHKTSKKTVKLIIYGNNIKESILHLPRIRWWNMSTST
jgi:hypothetical protein